MKHANLAGLMACELAKVKGSRIGIFVVLYPLIMVLTGTGMTLISGGFGTDGWHLLWARATGFYGMAMYAVGIAVIASLVWRVEHKGGNWNALMSSRTPAWGVMTGKTLAIGLLSALMQPVFLITAILVGKLAGLPGMLPLEYWWSVLASMIACLPVAAAQSAFSCFIRPFAPPIAMGLVMAGANTFLLLLHLTPAYFLPYGILIRATMMGSAASRIGTSFPVDPVTPATMCISIGTSIGLTLIIIAIASLILEKRDIYV